MKNWFIRLFKSFGETYFYTCSIMFVLISFLHLGEDRFWDLMGFAIIFSGLQEVINNGKTKCKCRV